MPKGRNLLIAALILGALGLVAFFLRPISMMDFVQAKASVCNEVSERCSWGNVTTTMSDAEYLRLSQMDRAALVRGMAVDRTKACGPDDMRLSYKSRLLNTFRVYFECSNAENTFIILVDGEYQARSNGDYSSDPWEAVLPSARVFWNWCKTSTCPESPSALFSVDPGG